jgi:hypothetical protein
MQFNQNGNLTPYEAIESTTDELRQEFVLTMPDSESRLRLFETYLEHLNDFKRQITPDFFHLVNGSFVTKKLNPNDLDLVVFRFCVKLFRDESLIQRKLT